MAYLLRKSVSWKDIAVSTSLSPPNKSMPLLYLWLILPLRAISIKPKKCRSLRELQTTSRMLTVCKPSISHSSVKNSSMMPTHHKSSSSEAATSHCLPHSQPHTLSLFVELQRHVFANMFMLFLFSVVAFLLWSLRWLPKLSPKEEWSLSNGLIINQPQRQERMMFKVENPQVSNPCLNTPY